MLWSHGSPGGAHTYQRLHRDHIDNCRPVTGICQCLTTKRRNAEMSLVKTPVVSALLVAIMEPQPWELRKRVLHCQSCTRYRHFNGAAALGAAETTVVPDVLV